MEGIRDYNEENLYYDKYFWYIIWLICLELKL